MEIKAEAVDQLVVNQVEVQASAPESLAVLVDATPGADPQTAGPRAVHHKVPPNGKLPKGPQPGDTTNQLAIMSANQALRCQVPRANSKQLKSEFSFHAKLKI